MEIPGFIVKKMGPVSYRVQLKASKQQLCRHQDHIRLRLTEVPDSAEASDQCQESYDAVDDADDDIPFFPQFSRAENPVPEPLRRSQRIRRPPQRYS